METNLEDKRVQSVKAVLSLLQGLTVKDAKGILFQAEQSLSEISVVGESTELNLSFFTLVG